jgi:hypothetical protein
MESKFKRIFGITSDFYVVDINSHKDKLEHISRYGQVDKSIYTNKDEALRIALTKAELHLRGLVEEAKDCRVSIDRLKSRLKSSSAYSVEKICTIAKNVNGVSLYVDGTKFTCTNLEEAEEMLKNFITLGYRVTTKHCKYTSGKIIV